MAIGHFIILAAVFLARLRHEAPRREGLVVGIVPFIAGSVAVKNALGATLLPAGEAPADRRGEGGWGPSGH
jgi:hypothetical protein